MELQLKLIILQIGVFMYIVTCLFTLQTNEDVIQNWTGRQISVSIMAHKILQFLICIVFGKYVNKINPIMLFAVVGFVVIYGNYLHNIANTILTFKLNQYSNFEITILFVLSRLGVITNFIIIFLGFVIGKNI